MTEKKSNTDEESQEEKKPAKPLDLPQLRERKTVLEREIKILVGRIANSDPAEIKKVEASITEAEARIVLLTRALNALVLEGTQPKTADESRSHNEDLRLAAVEYFETQTTINADLWKNVAS